MFAFQRKVSWMNSIIIKYWLNLSNFCKSCLAGDTTLKIKGKSVFIWEMAFPILHLQDNILFSLCLFLEKTIHSKPVFMYNHDSKWSHPDWTSKYSEYFKSFHRNYSRYIILSYFPFHIRPLRNSSISKGRKSVFRATLCRKSNLAFSF